MSQLSYPEWLNAGYFGKILASHYKNTSIKTEKIKVEPCGAADGFLSTLYRVHVDYKMNSGDHSKSFVVKTMSNEEMAIEKVGANGYDVQNKEMMFFEVIAPQIEKILRKIDDDDHVIPKAVLVDRKHEAIIFEDLQAFNFIMADRTNGMDESHFDISLDKLAKFHAASLIIHEKHPRAFDSFDCGMFSRKVTVFNDAFESIFEIVVEEVSTWPGFEKYAGKIEEILPSLVENATRCFDVETGDFCILNHGDVWTNNFMFKYGNEKKVEDSILVRQQNLFDRLVS